VCMDVDILFELKCQEEKMLSRVRREQYVFLVQTCDMPMNDLDLDGEELSTQLEMAR
jgi:hypothetical protein